MRRRWSAEGGYREFLRLALPLILSTASWSVQHFIDRVFLTWHSTAALAAALPAGMASFTFLSLFMGIVGYANTFVAQYIGARRPERVGPAVWQGIYLALVSGLLALIPAAFATPLFDLIGHDAVIRQEETEYFRILCYGTGPQVLSTAASCFFSGRGQTWVVLAVNVVAISVNILLDYGLIFGHWGLPAMGIAGAAWATNIGLMIAALSFLGLFLRRQYREEFATLRGWRFDPKLFRRLLRFGGPNGLNFMLDIMAFSLFILVVGKLGPIPLAATNLAFNVNSLAFMPLIGCGIAISTMVGQRLGRDAPAEAEYCTWTGSHIAFAYMGTMVLGYVFLPEFFLSPFDLRAQDADFIEARDTAIILLRFVAIYCLFDAFYMVFTAALKGAGDTRFIMWVSVTMAWAIMVIPSFVALTYFGAGLFVLWGFICAFIIIMGMVFFFRFRAGKWKSMRVIEQTPVVGEGEGAGSGIREV
ncbi:MAG: MATE family efflux transporter [Gemmatimonadetes bacterium]|nr:MATE family efflux transporter [Gemmatimonadota bacterium]